MNPMPATGLLYSQIGYDLDDPARALVRAPGREALGGPPRFRILTEAESEARSWAPCDPWGECWGAFWWVAEFSGLPEGRYRLEVAVGDETRWRTEPWVIAAEHLWHETVVPVGIEQFEARNRRARYRLGWKDCGHLLREANSHAASIVGLSILSQIGFEGLSEDELARLDAQIAVGADYLCACQDHAAALGLPTGSLVHELNTAAILVPGDAAQATAALALAGRTLSDGDPERSRNYIHRARRAWAYLISCPPSVERAGFAPSNHGAPEAYRPPAQLMTRELVMRLWAAVELWISGGDRRYQDAAVQLARRILERQVPASDPEAGFYGHFRTFDDSPFTEKANIHHHVGYDTGGIFPHFLVPLFEMQNRWTDHPDRPEWINGLREFAEGFFIPACQRNPFLLLPNGIFGEEGLLSFCGPWHGINATYAWAAVLANHLELITGDRTLRDIAVAHLQWIAGLNVGCTADSFASAVRFHPEIPPGEALPFSMIAGIGHRSVQVWSGIRGSIPNGFSANPQFQLSVAPTRENDRPTHFTDEDWIPHGAAWVAALAHLRQNRFFLDGKRPPTGSPSGPVEPSTPRPCTP